MKVIFGTKEHKQIFKGNKHQTPPPPPRPLGGTHWKCLFDRCEQFVKENSFSLPQLIKRAQHELLEPIRTQNVLASSD